MEIKRGSDAKYSANHGIETGNVAPRDMFTAGAEPSLTAEQYRLISRSLAVLASR